MIHQVQIGENLIKEARDPSSWSCKKDDEREGEKDSIVWRNFIKTKTFSQGVVVKNNVILQNLQCK